MYAYELEANPYPSSPTPTEKDARILGGKRHKEAKSAILECIKELSQKVSGRDSNGGDFRVITLIQDVGSGKTHLALHIRNLQSRHNTVCTFLDLSTISPKTMPSLYNALVKGFEDEFFIQLRTKLIEYIRDRAEQGDNSAKRALDYSLIDRLSGITIRQEAEDIISGKKRASVENLKKFLIQWFNHYESTIITSVITNTFDSINNLEELLGRMTAISKLTHRFLDKIILYEIDEFDGNHESIEFVKAIINAHIPASVVLLISTPSGYAEIQSMNASVFDRLEKANYKIDLAGSNSVDELSEIVLEYIKYNDKQGKFKEQVQNDLAEKIRVLYDEFPDFRSVRSIINILYHAMEKSQELNLTKIDEFAIDETIKHVYPGLKVRGSVMDVPISDFFKIRRDCNNDDVGLQLKNAVTNLVNFAHEMGNIGKLEKQNQPLDIIYQDPYGAKIGIAVVMNQNHSQNFEEISNVSKSSALVDKLVILTNANLPSSNSATIVNIDKSKIVDLIYFNSKYTNHKIINSDNEKAQMLAKTVSII
jgi:hypothetical protein